MSDASSDEASALFEQQRRTLFGIAYRMLGSVTDAEDVVQDAWLRWNEVVGRAENPVENPQAYLARTVTNLSLNRLRSAASRRETYVGPWLPEPLVASPEAVDGAEAVESAESISLAMLVVLESLSPLERAVFVLREVFGFAYAEIAAMLDRSEAAVRQVGSRARSHVQARRPRFEASAETARRVTEEFVAATMGGDLGRMMQLLAPDVTAWSDGGGKVKAALRPVRGADKVARWARGVMERGLVGEWAVEPVMVNGQPGALVTLGGVVESVISCDVLDGRVTAIRVVRNPDKLAHVRAP